MIHTNFEKMITSGEEEKMERGMVVSATSVMLYRFLKKKRDMKQT